MKPKFLFGDIVVVYEYHIGVVLKTWMNLKDNEITYDVFVRSANMVIKFKEEEIERYRVRHKFLSDEEHMYQNR